MKESEMNFIKKGLWLVIILFVLRCVITFPETPYECFGFAGEAITVGVMGLALYEKVLWKYNPLEKTPKIFGEYSGVLEYEYDLCFHKKNIKIIIGQSLLNTSVKIITDEMTSNTITSNFVYENGEFVLYYSYITTPKSKYSINNPIQYGTSRLTIQSDGLLEGSYWTTRQTKGDITFKKKLK